MRDTGYEIREFVDYRMHIVHSSQLEAHSPHVDFLPPSNFASLKADRRLFNH